MTKLRLVKGVPTCPVIPGGTFLVDDAKYTSQIGMPPCGRKAVHVCQAQCSLAFCSDHLGDHACHWTESIEPAEAPWGKV
jgi:hypothetical protein